MEKLAIRRPADGIHPPELEKVLGRKVVRAIPKETLLQWDMI
jgi:sialic acid synthase SpsE